VAYQTDQTRSATRNANVVKKPWITPTLNHTGSVADFLRSGGGKLSMLGGDPGEMRCEKPHDDRCR